MNVIVENRIDLERGAPELRRQVALAEQALRQAERELARVQGARRAGYDVDVGEAQEEATVAVERLKEARAAAAQNELELQECADAEAREREAAKSPAQRKAEQDFTRRHKAAVNRLRAAFSEFLAANEEVRELEHEAARLGLGKIPIFSWGDFRTPYPGASLVREAQWLTKTEEYING